MSIEQTEVHQVLLAIGRLEGRVEALSERIGASNRAASTEQVALNGRIKANSDRITAVEKKTSWLSGGAMALAAVATGVASFMKGGFPHG